uniref:Adenine nucleotide translocase lysine methyltransferase n=1 Tax=Catharus ustulatus TaxID=91951 RepID=A0A8C3V613_CATUS
LPAAMEPCWEPGEPGEPGWARPEGELGGRGLLALAVASGAAAWATWAVLLMPGFRRVPLRLQVPYQPSSPRPRREDRGSGIRRWTARARGSQAGAEASPGL